MIQRGDKFAPIADAYDLMARTTSADRYANLLDNIPDGVGRALDVGCGSAVLTLQIARKVGLIVGIDVSPSMLSLARENCAADGRNVVLLIADVAQPPFSDRSFELVVSCNVLQRLPLDPTLPVLRRLIRPGGRVVIDVRVSSWPRFHSWRPWRVVSALRSIPRLALGYGQHSAWKLAEARLRRALKGPWGRVLLPTPAAFRDACSRYLPGCRFVHRQPGAMTAIWDAPRDAQTR